MLLERKNAVIYGGGGTTGGAVARAFAREGATVHLAGRTSAKLDQVAREIREQGGTATTAQVDALDEAAVDAHADELVRNHGTLDVSMNLISTGDVQGTPLVEMALADFDRPSNNAIRSTHVVDRAPPRPAAPAHPPQARALCHRTSRSPPHDPPGLGGDPDVRRRG